MKYPIFCIESTVDLYLGEYNVRLWIDKKEIPEDHTEEQEYLKKIIKLENRDLKLNELMERIMDIVPNLNAIQIRNGAMGTVLYTKAFSEGEDPHG